MPYPLSKSSFMSGCQCTKRMYLHKFSPDLATPADDQKQAILNSGTAVGLLARDLFPGGVDASPPDPFSFHLSVGKTKILIESGVKIIYEAAFEHDGLMCALDILEKKEGRWYGYEVKGSGNVKKEDRSVKEKFMTDAAFQYYLITSSGMELANISIIYLNKNYVRHGALNLRKLFKFKSVRKKAIKMTAEIAQKATELKAIVAGGKIPHVGIGVHCRKPYPCEFIRHCWEHVPEDSVFDLRGSKKELRFKLYNQGIVKLSNIPPETKLPKGATFQLEHYLSKKEYLDRKAMTKFLKSFSYPLWFLDFETYKKSVPEFNNSRPVQEIPFQYSLHVMHSETSTPEHFEFLADPSIDPRESLIQSLLSHLGGSGSIVAYSASFEKRQLKYIARDFPLYAKSIGLAIPRFVDLRIPFRLRYYYHPEFKGSYSLKDVLPVMVHGMSYDHLAVPEGLTAGLTFLKMREEKDAGINEQHRKNLLEYCKMDTLAMVRIFEKLNSVM